MTLSTALPPVGDGVDATGAEPVALPASALTGTGLAPAAGADGERGELAVGTGMPPASAGGSGAAVAGDWLGWAVLASTVAGCAAAEGGGCAAASPVRGGWAGAAGDVSAAVACGAELDAAGAVWWATGLSFGVGGAGAFEASCWMPGATSASAGGMPAGAARCCAGIAGGAGSDAIWRCASASPLRVHSCAACIGARLLINRANVDATALVAFAGGELPEAPLADPALAPVAAGADDIADPDEEAPACDAPDCPAAADCPDTSEVPLAPL
jgi:hypothetical protein